MKSEIRFGGYLRRCIKYYEQRYTPKVKTGTRCNACSLKDICLPILNKKKSVSGYIDRIIADEEQE